MTSQIVSTLWIGSALGWTEQLCLSSFVAQGHPVRVYAYNPIERLPEGVEWMDAATIYTPPKGLLDATGPALVADIFRLHLSTKTDEIWVDADMVALHPFERCDAGYAIGYEEPKLVINNAVLAAPHSSEAVAMLLDYIENPTVAPAWLRPKFAHKIMRADLSDRIATIFSIKRGAMGPMALTHMLKTTKEDRFAKPMPVFYGVPWMYTDLYFTPFGRLDGWTDDTTRGVHLWSNLLRAFHKNNRPHPDSFVGQRVVDYGIDVSGLKPWKYPDMLA